MEQSTKEKLFSRQYWGSLFLTGTSTAILFWMLLSKCQGEVYDHESALKYLEFWGEINLWNLVVFGGARSVDKIAQFIPRRNQTQTP